MPVYCVKVKLDDHVQDRLVEAKTPAGAFKHVAKQHISVEQVRTGDQIKAMAELAALGVKVEVVADE